MDTNQKTMADAFEAASDANAKAAAKRMATACDARELAMHRRVTNPIPAPPLSNNLNSNNLNSNDLNNEKTPTDHERRA